MVYFEPVLRQAAKSYCYVLRNKSPYIAEDLSFTGVAKSKYSCIVECVGIRTQLRWFLNRTDVSLVKRGSHRLLVAAKGNRLAP